MNGFSPSQAIIAAMITPALLILASGSLIATALVRLARVIYRVRKLSEIDEARTEAEELRRHKHRAVLAERAVRLFFLAVVCFVVAGFFIAIDHLVGDRLTWLPVSATTGGMCLLIAGSAEMLSECSLAAAQLHAEIRTFRQSRPNDGPVGPA
jgi:hypothetical protein